MRLLLFFLAVLAASAQAQTLDDLLFFGQRSPAVGPRLTAMGGAATAGLGDWDAAYANPAGLAYLRSAQAVASAEAFVNEADGFGRGFARDEEGVVLETVGYAAPLPVVRGALAFGGGYHTTASYLRTTEAGGRDQRGRRESGWQGAVSAAGAVALSPRLMGGLSVNAPVGRYERTSGPDGDFDGGFSTRDTELAGVNVRAGLSAALDYGLRLGLTVESPTWLRLDQQGEDETADGDIEIVDREVVMRTPWRVAVGFLAGSPAVLVSADVEVVDWGQARFLADGDPDLLYENAFADSYLRPVLNTRLGVEGLVGPVALRAGAAFQPDPRYVGPTPEVIRQTYAVGAGVNVHPQARLDVTLIHVRDDSVAPFPVGVEGHGTRNAVQVGVDVRF